MNIYEKLQTARVELQETALKKSGQNKFAGYEYFELADFMPQINKLMLEYKMIGVVSFGEFASLKIINAEKPEEVIEFLSPMSTANLKGCHDVQNLGAVQTYLRRYLYVVAFEIVERDALDATTGKDNKPSNSSQTGVRGQGGTNTPTRTQAPATGQTKPPAGQTKPPAGEQVIYCTDCTLAITKDAVKVKEYSEKTYGQCLCRDCQKKHTKTA